MKEQKDARLRVDALPRPPRANTVTLARLMLTFRRRHAKNTINSENSNLLVPVAVIEHVAVAHS
jgi:hypothetical protein